MSSLNFSAAIQKGKKLKGAKKVEDLEFNETIDPVKSEKLNTIQPVTASPVPKTKKVSPEDTMEIDLILGSAKKKPQIKVGKEPTKSLSPMGEQMDANDKALKKKKYMDSLGKFKKGN